MRKKFGDRKDAKKVRDLDGLHRLQAHISNKRSISEVYINEKIDVTKLVSYIEKRKENKEEIKTTYFHVFCTAIARTIFNRKLLNRYIINRRHFDREDVSISFVAKVAFNDEAKENISVVKIKENDNLDVIKNKISNKVNNVRSNKNNDTDNVVETIGRFPVFITRVIVGFVKFLDNHDLLPKSFVSDNLYYSTVIVSNLGSIKCGAVYHHLTDFGTNSMILTIGEVKKEGNKYFCEFGLTVDERIADGVYFAKSLKIFEYILNNPKLLEVDVGEKINEEIKIRD